MGEGEKKLQNCAHTRQSRTIKAQIIGELFGEAAVCNIPGQCTVRRDDRGAQETAASTRGTVA